MKEKIEKEVRRSKTINREAAELVEREAAAIEEITAEVERIERAMKKGKVW